MAFLGTVPQLEVNEGARIRARCAGAGRPLRPGEAQPFPRCRHSWPAAEDGMQTAGEFGTMPQTGRMHSQKQICAGSPPPVRRTR